MSSLAATLGSIELRDPEGQTVRLGEHWKDRPAVLVFIRHFG